MGFAGAMVVLARKAVHSALFLVLNKADPRQADLWSISRYWDLYADDPVLRKKLVASIAIPATALLVVLPIALITAMRPRRALHGDARFANRAEINRAGLLLDANPSNQPSILVGRLGRRFLALPGQLSVMLSAPICSTSPSSPP